MKVILTDHIKKLGKKYDVVDVSNGYAHNFLFRKQLAVVATTEAEKEYSAKRSEISDQLAKEAQTTSELAEKIKEHGVSIKATASATGSLYEKIKEADILEAIKDQYSMEVNPAHLILPDTIKELGEFDLSLEVDEMKQKFTLTVISDKEVAVVEAKTVAEVSDEETEESESVEETAEEVKTEEE